MTVDSDGERLSQANMLADMRRDIPLLEILTVYFSDIQTTHNHGIYSALIPSNRVEDILAQPTWDLIVGDGVPGAVGYRIDDQKRVDYLRFGNDEGIEPLVIYLCTSKVIEGKRAVFDQVGRGF